MFESFSPELIRNQMADSLKTDINTGEGSFANDILSPIALEIWKLYATIDAVTAIFYPSEDSGEYLDKRCGYYGIIRKAGTRAETVLTILGTSGKIIPKRTAFLNAEGLVFLTESDAVISDGSVEVTAVAENVGAKYNVAAGEIDHPLSSVSGVVSVTNSAALGGTDPESDKSLLERLLAYLQEPSTSGNVYDYRRWALECEGVGSVKVTPLWNGAGTVKVMVVSEDKKPVDELTVSKVFEHIESLRPIGATVAVGTAEALNINISADIVIDKSVTLEEVTETFKAAIDSYFGEISFSKYTVPYIRIGYLLAGISGVTDYSNLKINGGVENISVGSEQIPQRGTVVLNESN